MSGAEAVEWMKAHPCQVVDADYPPFAFWRLNDGRVYAGCRCEECDCCEGSVYDDAQIVRMTDEQQTEFTPRRPE